MGKAGFRLVRSVQQVAALAGRPAAGAPVKVRLQGLQRDALPALADEVVAVKLCNQELCRIETVPPRTSRLGIATPRPVGAGRSWGVVKPDTQKSPVRVSGQQDVLWRQAHKNRTPLHNGFTHLLGVTCWRDGSAVSRHSCSLVGYISRSKCTVLDGSGEGFMARLQPAQGSCSRQADFTTRIKANSPHLCHVGSNDGVMAVTGRPCHAGRSTRQHVLGLQGCPAFCIPPFDLAGLRGPTNPTNPKGGVACNCGEPAETSNGTAPQHVNRPQRKSSIVILSLSLGGFWGAGKQRSEQK